MWKQVEHVKGYEEGQILTNSDHIRQPGSIPAPHPLRTWPPPTMLSRPEVDGVQNVLHRCDFKTQEIKWFSGNKAWRINGLEQIVLAPLTQNHTSKLIEGWWLHRKLLSVLVICTTEIPVFTSQGCCDRWLGGLRKTTFTCRAPHWD